MDMPSSFPVFMQDGGWVFYSLGAALFSAFFYLVNQYCKQSGDMLVFLMRVTIVLLMAPFAHLIDWPENPAFYVTVFLTVLVGTSADMRTLNVSAAYGGGVVSRVMPVTVLGAFFLWFFVRPELLSDYAGEPLRALAICAALALCVHFAMRLNRCHIARQATVRMLPALAGYTIVSVLNKYAIDFGAQEASFDGVVYGYMYAQSILAVLIFGPYVLWRRRPAAVVAGEMPLTGARALRLVAVPAVFAAVVWLAHMILKNYAIAYVANPAYQAAINLTTPVMILLIYRMTGHREESDVRAGMGVVLACLLLAIATTWK